MISGLEQLLDPKIDNMSKPRLLARLYHVTAHKTQAHALKRSPSIDSIGYSLVFLLSGLRLSDTQWFWVVYQWAMACTAQARGVMHAPSCHLQLARSYNTARVCVMYFARIAQAQHTARV